MDSNEVKTHLISYMLWQWNYLGVVTEYDNYSDVFGIKRTFYTAEFEIKLTRGDLLYEVNIIKKIINNDCLWGKGGHKTSKHNRYLVDLWCYDKRSIPNEFNFVCSDNIVDSGIVKMLKNTPYGLYVFPQFNIKGGIYHQAIRPKKLHKEKIREKDLVRFFRKLST